MNQTEIKRICIYGVGGVGGYFGGQMTYNLEKQKIKTPKIFFIARGEHLQRIQKDGLLLKTTQMDMVVHPSSATNDFESLETPDVVLICVKGYDLDDALEKISKNINKKTIIIPLLNGVDIYHRIREKLDFGIILPSCVYMGTHIEKPGVVTQSGGDGKIIFGRDPGKSDFDINSVINLFHRLNINFEYRKDSFPAIWEKYIFIAAFGLVGAAYNKTLGEIMENTALKNSVKQIMGEIVALAEMEGVKLPENIIEDSLEKGNNFPYDTTTSYHKDIELKGYKNEGDLFGGTIIRLGEKYGVKTPFSQEMYSIIQKRLDTP